jgi:protein-L-isoaspartate(D-aspartate) O-methyltransferase
MTQLELYQNLIIKKALPLHEKVIEAFYAYPRHLFVQKYRPRGWAEEWVELTSAEEIDRHLTELYEDHPLLLYENDGYVSTISQPSFVLKIIDMMDLHPGHRVFELGSGSGWTSALMSHIVGPKGHIISTEIIPEMAARARTAHRAFGIQNVTLKQADGFEGDAEEAPFDRIVFTAGSREFPHKLFAQLKENGLMVFVQSHLSQADSLELIRKHDGKAQLLESQPCSFVSVRRNINEQNDRAV